MRMAEDVWICATCGVEHESRRGICAICADERQWVPAGGQIWTSLAELEASGHRADCVEIEPDLFGVTVDPKVGIGQRMHCVRTPQGVLLWDPVGFVDERIARQVRALGEVLAITSSHPHMFGAQVSWSRALGGAPVLVCEPDVAWVARPDPVIRTWSGSLVLAPGLTLRQLGGHFPGSAVVHWQAGAGGRGVLLCSDTLQANPDRASVTFMRSYPNRIPLSPAVTGRIAGALAQLRFEHLYDNVGRAVLGDAAGVVRGSAQRYIAWAQGDFDKLT